MDDATDRIVWQPSEEEIAHANITAFMQQINIHNHPLHPKPSQDTQSQGDLPDDPGARADIPRTSD